MSLRVKTKKAQTRGTSRRHAVVLSRRDAAMVYRWLAYVLDGEGFYSPFVASLTREAALVAMRHMGRQLRRTERKK